MELNWRKSTYSAQEGNCVEQASGDGAVYVQDSKNPGPMLRVSPSEWAAFVEGLK